MSPMRILHVSETLDPAHGGTPAVPKALACAMVGLGHDVTILTRDEPARADAIRESMADMPDADRVEIVTVPRGGAIDRLVNRRARDWVWEHAGSFDFAHLHSMWSPIPHGAARGLAGIGVPYTLCPHGMLDHWTMQQSGIKKRAHLAAISRNTMRRCAFIHALNDYEATCIDRFCFGPRCEVIHNGIFPDRFAQLPDADEFVGQHPSLRGKPYILFLGRLHHKKGLDFLADAFVRIAPQHPEAMLAVVGPDGGERDRFAASIERAGLSHRLVMPGPIYGAGKLAALAGAACFCLPSRQEGFSVAICEALACGAPVVISEACHFPEVGSASAGIITPLDAADIARALDRILSDQAAARTMGDAGRRLVLDRYTWSSIGRRCEALYAAHAARP